MCAIPRSASPATDRRRGDRQLLADARRSACGGISGLRLLRVVPGVGGPTRWRSTWPSPTCRGRPCGHAGVGAVRPRARRAHDDGVARGSLLAHAAVTLGARRGTDVARRPHSVIHALRSLSRDDVGHDAVRRGSICSRGSSSSSGSSPRTSVSGASSWVVRSPRPVPCGQLGDEFDCDVHRCCSTPSPAPRSGRVLEAFELVRRASRRVRCSIVTSSSSEGSGAARARRPHRARSDSWLRTGAARVGGIECRHAPPIAHTVGDHVLRGAVGSRSPAIDRSLARIDGVDYVAPGQSSRDGHPRSGGRRRFALDRPTLVDDQMWAGRIREAVASVVPVRVDAGGECQRRRSGREIGHRARPSGPPRRHRPRPQVRTSSSRRDRPRAVGGCRRRP